MLAAWTRHTRLRILARDSLILLMIQPPRNVAMAPDGTTTMPTIWAENPADNWYCVCTNLGESGDEHTVK